MFYGENGQVDLEKCKSVLIKQHKRYLETGGKEGVILVFNNEDLTKVHFFGCEFHGNHFRGSRFEKCCFDETTSEGCYRETEVKLG